MGGKGEGGAAACEKHGFLFYPTRLRNRRVCPPSLPSSSQFAAPPPPRVFKGAAARLGRKCAPRPGAGRSRASACGPPAPQVQRALRPPACPGPAAACWPSCGHSAASLGARRRPTRASGAHASGPPPPRAQQQGYCFKIEDLERPREAPQWTAGDVRHPASTARPPSAARAHGLHSAPPALADNNSSEAQVGQGDGGQRVGARTAVHALLAPQRLKAAAAQLASRLPHVSGAARPGLLTDPQRVWVRATPSECRWPHQCHAVQRFRAAPTPPSSFNRFAGLQMATDSVSLSAPPRAHGYSLSAPRNSGPASCRLSALLVSPTQSAIRVAQERMRLVQQR